MALSLSLFSRHTGNDSKAVEPYAWHALDQTISSLGSHDWPFQCLIIIKVAGLSPIAVSTGFEMVHDIMMDRNREILVVVH